jgi:ABC-2 type transport system permease protein
VLLLCAWLRREWTLRRRYAWDTLAELLTGYAVFMLLALGARVAHLQRMGFGPTESGLIVAFMILTLVMASYRRLAFCVASEAQAGMLEQIAMSSHGRAQVWFTRVVSVFVTSLFFATVQLLLMMLSTGHWLSIDAPRLLPVVVFTYASGQGVGLMLGGLAIVHKQIQELFQLGSWMFLGLTLFSPADFPVLRFLPVAWGTELARHLMLRDSMSRERYLADVGFLCCHGTAWFVLGFAMFLLAEKRARVAGSLGHY